LSLSQYFLLRTNKLRQRLRSSSQQKLIHIKRSQGFSDRRRKITEDHNDRDRRDNQRVEIKASRDGLSSEVKVDVRGDVTYTPGESLACRISTVNENRISPENKSMIESIIQKIGKRANEDTFFHLDPKKRFSEERLASSSLDQEEKEEECEELKSGKISPKERKSIESFLVKAIIDYQFFGRSSSSCEGSAGHGENEFSITQDSTTSALNFGIDPGNSKNTFFCESKIDANLIGNFKRLSLFNIKNPNTWENLRENERDFKCSCKEDGRTQEKECSMGEALRRGRAFYSTPIGQKVLEMERKLAIRDESLEELPEQRLIHGEGIKSLEEVSEGLKGCATKTSDELKRAVADGARQKDPDGNGDSLQTGSDSIESSKSGIR